MGCCGSRHGEIIKINRDKLQPFIQSQNYDFLTCHQIRKLKNTVWDKPSFESYAKESHIPVPFDLIQQGNKVYPLDLKLTLLIFSKDAYEEKLKLFEKLLKTEREKLKFFEWRYQILNERLPKIMNKKSEIDEEEEERWINTHRLSAGNEICECWKEIKSEGFKPTPSFLSVN